MTVAMHDHIHLDTDDPPADTYKVIHGTWDPTPMVLVSTERALTGKLHVHRLVDDGGATIQFHADKMRLKSLDTEDMLAVKALIGQTVYLALNYHDDNEDGAGSLKAWSDGSAYVIRGVLTARPGAISNMNPIANLWTVEFEIVDDSAVV